MDHRTDLTPAAGPWGGSPLPESPWPTPTPPPAAPRRPRGIGWLIGGAGLLAVLAGAGFWYAYYLPEPAAPAPEAKRTPIAKNIFLEIQGPKRRVIVTTTVCLREGQLEGLLCI